MISNTFFKIFAEMSFDNFPNFTYRIPWLNCNLINAMTSLCIKKYGRVCKKNSWSFSDVLIEYRQKPTTWNRLKEFWATFVALVPDWLYAVSNDLITSFANIKMSIWQQENLAKKTINLLPDHFIHWIESRSKDFSRPMSIFKKN